MRGDFAPHAMLRTSRIVQARIDAEPRGSAVVRREDGTIHPRTGWFRARMGDLQHAPSFSKVATYFRLNSRNGEETGGEMLGARCATRSGVWSLSLAGVNIISTIRNGGYAFFNGTSIAAPHVAGAAALMLAANGALTVDQLRAGILTTVDPLTSLAGFTSTGGRAQPESRPPVCPRAAPRRRRLLAPSWCHRPVTTGILT